MNLQQNTEWFAQRSGKVTGSRIPIVLGLSPWSKPDDLMRDMVREWHGEEPEFQGNVATDWGNAKEDEAIRWYAEQTRNIVHRCAFIQHSKLDWVGDSPDGLVIDEDDAEGAVEIKCPFSQRIPEEPEPHYVAQCQWHCEHLDVEWCDLVYWTPEGGRIFRIERDRDWFANAIKQARVFYEEFLLQRELPEAQQHLDPKVVERDDTDWVRAAEVYRHYKATIEQATKELEAAKKTLLDMADGKSTKGGGVLVSIYKQAGSVDWRKAAQAAGITGEGFQGKESVRSRITTSED